MVNLTNSSTIRQKKKKLIVAQKLCCKRL